MIREYPPGHTPKVRELGHPECCLLKSLARYNFSLATSLGLLHELLSHTIQNMGRHEQIARIPVRMNQESTLLDNGDQLRFEAAALVLPVPPNHESTPRDLAGGNDCQMSLRWRVYTLQKWLHAANIVPTLYNRRSRGKPSRPYG